MQRVLAYTCIFFGHMWLSEKDEHGPHSEAEKRNMPGRVQMVWLGVRTHCHPRGRRGAVLSSRVDSHVNGSSPAIQGLQDSTTTRVSTMSADASSSSTPPTPSRNTRRHSKTPSTASFYPTHATRASYSVDRNNTSQFAAPFKPLNEQETIQDRAEAVSSALEDAVDSYSHPLKPYLPAIGRFLIVVTFLEDALRLVLLALGKHEHPLMLHR